jgi:hypothetical protein
MILTIICLLLFCACSLLPDSCIGNLGRGDWTVNIYGEYELVRVNSRGITIGKRHDGQCWSNPIPQFFITGFCVREPFILLEGIKTADTFLSDEEKDARILSYYALNTTDNSVIGPFDTVEALSEEITASRDRMDARHRSAGSSQCTLLNGICP